MIIKSKYTCPVCDVNLSLEDTLSGGVALWCAYKNCPSYSAGKGAESKSEPSAFYQVQKSIEQEINQNDQHGPMCGCDGCMTHSLEEWASR